MPTEKHGGLWHDGSQMDGWRLVFERHDPQAGLLGVVFRKDALFKAVIHGKSFDPQWSLPWWSAKFPEALFDSEVASVAYLDTTFHNFAAAMRI